MKEKTDLLVYERELAEKGYRFICGIDEVGRGPLAGPVTVCAAIMDLHDIVDRVNDSKKLSEKVRENLYPLIKERAVDYKIVMVSPEEIDRINILQATLKAMDEASKALVPAPDYLLVDAVRHDFSFPYMPIIKGDSLSYSIACASILAKVERDRMMTEYAKEYPEYGFEKHKGYGTAFHIEMIKKYGPCPLHRRTFIKRFVTGI